MTATEARKIALDVHLNASNSQLSIIMGMIKQAAGDGKYETWVYNTTIQAEVRERLEANGFKVGPTQNDRNEILTKIEW